jgi:GT2 family glycosyltransferase
MRPTIDIVIATHQRPELFERCVRSLTAAAAAPLRFLVCSSGSLKGYERTLSSLGNSLVHVHSEKPLNAAAARNRVLSSLASEWVYFIDDDAHVEADFFENFLRILDDCSGAAVIGGPNLTLETASEFQKTSGAVLASRFAASRCALRYTRKHPRQKRSGELSLISCNLFVRRDALRDLRFPENLRSNEENWLMQDLRAGGHRFVYDPELFVWHERRPNLRLFARQIYRYGFGRGQNMRLRPSSARIDFLIPSVALILSAVSVSTWSAWSTGILFSIYLAALTAAVLRLDLSSGPRGRLQSAFLIPLVHVCYGCGVLRGLVGGRE